MTVHVRNRLDFARSSETIAGNLGCGIVMDPALIEDITEGDGNYLVISRVPAGHSAVHYAGFGWDRSGDFPRLSDWETYVRQFAARLASPLEISISPR